MKPVKPPQQERDKVVERYVAPCKYSHGVIRNVLEIARQEVPDAVVSVEGGRLVWTFRERRIADLLASPKSNKVKLCFFVDELADARGLLEGKKGKLLATIAVGGWPIPKDASKRRENPNHDELRAWFRAAAS